MNKQSTDQMKHWIPISMLYYICVGNKMRVKIHLSVHCYNQCHVGKVSTYFQLLAVSSRIFQLWILKIILLVVTLRKASSKFFVNFFLANWLTAF